jgi:hypothetical protein
MGSLKQNEPRDAIFVSHFRRTIRVASHSEQNLHGKVDSMKLLTLIPFLCLSGCVTSASVGYNDWWVKVDFKESGKRVIPSK